MLHTKFRENRPAGSGFLKGFYHIWAWRPSWSCDPDAANKVSFPLPKEAPHKSNRNAMNRNWSNQKANWL